MHRQIARAKAKKAAKKQSRDGSREGYSALPQDSDEEAEEVSWRRYPCLRWLPDCDSEHFAAAVGVVIIANALILGMETDLGQDNFIVFEHFFAVVFTLEMCLRLLQYGCYGYFSNPSNCFDCFLVAIGDFDVWFAPLMELLSPDNTRSHGPPKFLKLLRMFRAVRIVRLFKMFHELEIILEAFFRALHTVMWVGLLTMIINYVVAVFLTQILGHNASLWGDQEEDILSWFGSIGNSMRTLFIIITLAQWDHIALVVSEKFNGILVFSIAIGYITMTAFTMVSLITGIISEELVATQRDDELHKIEQIEKDKASLVTNVRTLLTEVDDDDSGTLSEEEINNAMASKTFSLMSRLGAMDIHMEMPEFLGMIKRLREARESDEVPIEDIVDSLKHLSGTASSSSIWDLKMLLLQVQNEFGVINSKLSEDIKELHQMHRDMLNAFSIQHRDMKASFEENGQSIAAMVKSIAKIERRLEGGSPQSLLATTKHDKMLEQQELILSRLDAMQEGLMDKRPPLNVDAVKVNVADVTSRFGSFPLNIDAVNVDLADVTSRFGSPEKNFQSETGVSPSKISKYIGQTNQVPERQDAPKDPLRQEFVSSHANISFTERQDTLKDDVWQELASTHAKVSEAIDGLETVYPALRSSSPAGATLDRPPLESWFTAPCSYGREKTAGSELLEEGVRNRS